MIMRDMDRASTMNPTMVDMGNTHHWVDRSVWTETSARPAPSATAGLDHRAAHGDPPDPARLLPDRTRGPPRPRMRTVDLGWSLLIAVS